ncbi:histidine phosphatase family protein [Aureliella helgolandensis]|uniref:Phosphoserine phosphatase 1 n=1 Tax=Aureliella helgolandensis TaxID=2527968 RepID=A0A518FZY2_9BACT|nr:histidine phosphatase family protein [Aureliella helgolandensis]QDV21860.1 Phosphoserine phosphatase 1 [Aureliella helgolandensis]
MTEIVLIRHGQSANNSLPAEQRVPDPALTELGALQARETARWLAQSGPTHLYCSPFLRSLETARPLAEMTNLPVFVHGELFEEGGCYSGHAAGQEIGEPGMGQRELAARYPTWSIDVNIPETGWWNRNYESPAEALARAARTVAWMQETLLPLGGQHVLVIHADFKRRLLEVMLPTGTAGNMADYLGPLHNCGVTRIYQQGERWMLRCVNATGHLDTNAIT